MARTLELGTGVALAMGLLTGVAMRPELAVDGRPAGPQIFAGWSGVRSTGPFDDGLAYASYAGKIPDYVMGTDWLKLASAPAVAAEPEPSPAEEVSYYDSPLRDEAEAPPPVEAAAAARGTDASEHISYPSLDGGAAYQDASRAEMTPTAAMADIDSEAPPEATGDTSRVR